MTEIKTLVYGIYPKTEHLRKSLNRWERGKLSVKELKTILKEEKDDVFRLFQENRISCFTDPLFNWYDVLRPLALITEGFELGPLTRYKETNTFYRQPVVDRLGGLKEDPEGDAELEANPPLPLYQGTGHDGFVAFLPSPISFYRLSKVEEGITFEEFSKAVLKNYESILDSAGVRSILLFEPLEYGPADSLSILDEFLGKYKVTLVTTGHLNEENFSSLKGKFESIIVGENENDLRIAAKYSETPGVGLIDAHNTKLENAAEVRSKAQKIASDLGVGKIVVANSDYLDFLPRSVSDRKIRVLSEIGD